MSETAKPSCNPSTNPLESLERITNQEMLDDLYPEVKPLLEAQPAYHRHEAAEEDDIPPYVQINASGDIEVHIPGVPSNIPQEIIEASELIRLVHERKHLYRDGDRRGQKAYEETLRSKGCRKKTRLCIDFYYRCTMAAQGILVIKFEPERSGVVHWARISKKPLEYRSTPELSFRPDDWSFWISRIKEIIADDLQVHVMSIYANSVVDNVRPNYLRPYKKLEEPTVIATTTIRLDPVIEVAGSAVC